MNLNLCLIFLLTVWGVGCFAQTTSETPLEEMTEIQKKSNLLQEQQREILADIYKMTGLQRRLATKKSQQLQRREELEADVADLQQDIQEVTAQIQILRKKIVLRMRNLHRVSAPTIFQSFFGAHDLNEMDRNARILYKISKADIEQLRTFRGLKNLLSEQQTKLEKKIADFEKNQKSLERQETAIKKTYSAQMNLLRKLGEQDQSMVNKLKQIKKEAIFKTTEKDTLVASLFEGGIYEKKGQLELPTTGVLSKRFGLLQMSSPKIRVYNKGWFISTPPQKEVVAIHKGQIAHVGYLPGFNNVVILDHGDHFYSVYANLSQAQVQVGDEIEALTTLGQVGQSRLHGQGLYFEMRHFSQSEDPAEWFKDSKFHLSSVKEQEL
jgi:murein hydrolase activator